MIDKLDAALSTYHLAANMLNVEILLYAVKVIKRKKVTVVPLYAAVF